MGKVFDGDSKKQKILYWSSIIGLAIFFLSILYVFGQEEISSSSKPRELKIVTPGSLIDKKDVWMSQVENDNKLQDKEIDFLKGVVLGNATGQSGDKSVSQIEILKEKIDALEKQINSGVQSNSSSSTNTPSSSPAINEPEHLTGMVEKPRSLNQFPSNLDAINSTNIATNNGYPLQSQPSRPNVEIGKFVISSNFSKKHKPNYKDFIPSGSIFKAVLLGGVSAKCGVNEPADPQPIPIRILDNGSLPNNFSSHLKRCRLIGAASGDVSTERVFVRTERLSCIDTRTGEVTEIQVEGHITGPDGINGISGVVEDRSGAMTSRAALSGVLNGISQAFSVNAQNNNLANQLSTMKDLAKENGAGLNLNMDTLKSSASQGAGDALKMLSEYWIKRAEQLQPVIKVEPSTAINIVVTKGFSFNDIKEQRQVSNKNNQDDR
jgi:conjugal transfer pilus assembly protein TraB